MTEKKQGKSCCSGKKRNSLETTKQVDEIAVSQDREIVPTVKQASGCQCCSSKPAEDKPVEECTSPGVSFLTPVADDGRPQPVVMNFRCACGTFRGCCWGTCYPGCKCPGM